MKKAGFLVFSVCESATAERFVLFFLSGGLAHLISDLRRAWDTELEKLEELQARSSDLSQAPLGNSRISAVKV